MMIKIVVDSTADLPNEFFSNYDIEIIPLIVNIDEKSYRDKIEISLEELYQSLRDNHNIKTSQPNIQDIHDILLKHAQNNDEVIIITISARLSGTYQTIKLVSDNIKEEYPNFKVEIIDSKGGSAIAGLMALQAAYSIRKNLSFSEITKTLEEMANTSEHIFTVDDLRYLFTGGRLKRAAAFIGNLLKIKPILHVRNGEILLYDKVRGSNKALGEIANIVEERIKSFPNQMLAIMHANDLERAHSLKEKIIEKLGNIKIIISQIGSVLGTHLGIGGVGVFFFSKRPKYYFLND